MEINDENQNDEAQVFEPADEKQKSENKEKDIEHKDLMLSKVEGAVNSMIQNENENSVSENDTQ